MSCSQKKDLIDFEIKQRDTESLLLRMQEESFDFDWMLARASCTVDIAGDSKSFKITVKAKRDSAISIALSYANIEGMRIVVTQDSVKFTNRQNSTYFLGNMDYVNKNFKLNIDFNMLQGILVGNQSIPFEEGDKPLSWIDSSTYLISTIRDRKLRKSLVKEQKMERLSRREESVLQYRLDPETFKIIQVAYSRLHDDRTLFAEYDDFELVGEDLFPHTCSITLEDSTQATTVSVKYLKVKVDKPQTIDFNIPEKYEQIY